MACQATALVYLLLATHVNKNSPLLRQCSSHKPVQKPQLPGKMQLQPHSKPAVSDFGEQRVLGGQGLGISHMLPR
jgi:hypothetical protein